MIIVEDDLDVAPDFFEYFSATKTWASAESACVAWGGHLASATSSVENAQIAAFSPDSASVWFGLNDIAIEGTWVWTDGSSTAYSNWADAEPNNSGGEDCGSMECSKLSHPWNDARCSDLKPYVCSQEKQELDIVACPTSTYK